MIETILIFLLVFNIVGLALIFGLRSRHKNDEIILQTLNRIEFNLKEDFRVSREEIHKASKENRFELKETIKDFQLVFERNLNSFSTLQKEKFDQLLDSTEKKLEKMRETVDEKLQKTLNERLAQSFATVGQQLQTVQEGLGEMRMLAHDVGGLKKVLGNVKMRGGLGEIQLSMLLEQILAPDQYAANVKTKENSKEVVEFAVKLPGKEDGLNQVWLPIDAKFPKDVYEQLLAAYDSGEVSLIAEASKNFDSTIKKMAKDISEIYLNPPYTTDFGVMFLPFEGIYAEVVRKASLLETLHKEYKIIVTGPSTLAALLNSLQMGFKTLAIQRRSSEVWGVLAAVKKEFENFGSVMQKAQNNIKTGLNQLDELMGRRTRAIQKQLQDVEQLSAPEIKISLQDSNEMASEE
jgi:DNA recombination protein RmuC